MSGSVVVVDVGKTHAKLWLFDGVGTLLDHSVHVNAVVTTDGVRHLDVAGICGWLTRGLAGFARRGPIEALVPVAHGAAGVLMEGDRPVAALDYEAQPPPQVASAYALERDPFEATLSPSLPGGLNLGAQLFWLEQLHPDIWPRTGQFLLWPQFWAWWLCGERASEVTSLGCHSDLWRPDDARWSDLSDRRGWSARMPPLKAAREVLGVVRPALRARLGIDGPAKVYCGLHDTNAALYAASLQPELAGRPFSLVSTGTWFVCLQSGAHLPFAYDPSADMLGNVDLQGRVIPTVRFMGGRRYEEAMGQDLGAVSDPGLLDATAWRSDVDTPVGKATRASLDLAIRTEAALARIGAIGPIVLEGRFATDRALLVALAAGPPRRPVCPSAHGDSVRAGALLLALPGLT